MNNKAKMFCLAQDSLLGTSSAKYLQHIDGGKWVTVKPNAFAFLILHSASIYNKVKAGEYTASFEQYKNDVKPQNTQYFLSCNIQNSVTVFIRL